MTSPANTNALRTFKSLNAGSTVIRADGTRIYFNGAPGGHGSLITSDPATCRFLEQHCATSHGQLWEETPTTDAVVQAASADSVVDSKKVTQELTERAVVGTNPAIAAMQAKLGAIATAPAAQQANF